MAEKYSDNLTIDLPGVRGEASVLDGRNVFFMLRNGQVAQVLQYVS